MLRTGGGGVQPRRRRAPSGDTKGASDLRRGRPRPQLDQRGGQVRSAPVAYRPQPVRPLRSVERARRQAANDARVEAHERRRVAGRGNVAGPPTPAPQPKVIRFAQPGPERDAALRRLVTTHRAAQNVKLEPAIKVLQQYSRPVHAVAGGTRAAIHGQNPIPAAVRGAKLKDRVLFSDVLKDLGAPKVVQSVGGFGLDVTLDPATWFTGGLSATAREAAAHAGTRAAAKALRSGANRREAVAAARSASRKALATHPANRGVSLGFGPFRSSGRTTAKVAEKTKLPERAERVRTSRVGRATRHVNPNYRPAGVSREAWQGVRDAQRRARHMTVVGERDARNRAIAVQREMERGGGSDAKVVDALERRTPDGLNEHERRVYTALERDYHDVHGREHALGLVGDKFREFGYAPRRHVSEVAPPGAPGSLGVSRRGIHSADPESSRYRTNRKMRSEFRGTGEDVYVPEVAVAHYLRMRDSSHRVAQKHLIDTVAKQGKRFGQHDIVPEGHGVYELRARNKPRLLDKDELRAVRASDSADPRRLVVLPKDLANRAFEGVASIDELRGLGIAWDRTLQGRVKTVLTVPNPQYHLTNLYGDTFNAWLGQGAPKLARNLGTSARVLRRQAQEQRAARDLQRTPGARDTTIKVGKRRVPIDTLMRQAREDVGGTGFVGRDLPEVLHSQTKEALEGMGRGRFAGKVPGASRVARTPGGRAVGHPIDAIRGASQYREDWVRIASYLGARRRGMSRDAAARFVQQHHFDYGDLSQFEKSVARRVLPFYTFTARNTPLQVKAALTRPGKYATLEKAREETARAAGLPDGYEGNLESYEQRGQPFGLPGIKVGGKPAMLYPKLPSMDLGRLTTPDSFSPADLAKYPGKVVRAQSEFLMAMLSPLIKTPAELTSNYNSFFRDKIDALVDAPSPLTGDRAFERKPMPGYIAERMPKWMRDGLHVRQVRDPKSGKTLWAWPAKLDYLLKQTPLSGTALQYGTGVENSRGQSAGLRMQGFLTGLKVAPYDATDRAARRQAAEYRYLDAKAQEARKTGDARTAAGVMTPEYRALLKRKNELAKKLGYLGRKPTGGGTGAFDFQSAPKQADGSSVPQGFDFKSVKPPS